MVELGQEMGTMALYRCCDAVVPGHNALVETEDSHLIRIIGGVHYLLFNDDEAHAALGPPRIITKVPLGWKIVLGEIGLVSSQNHPITHQGIA
jgi:hypothetical protein